MNSVWFSDARVDLSADLEAARRVIESHFLAAGEVLTQSIEGIDALVGSLENLVKALDAKAVAASTEDMQVASHTLLGLADNHRGRQKTVEELEKHRDNLAKSVSEMRSSLAYMRAFTVNIKIVSSGIAEAGSTFESFAQEISDCIESGREELRKLEEDIAELHGELASAQAQGAVLTARINKLLPVLPNELSESAGLMATHFTRVSAIAGDVAEIARGIQKRVVRVLQALQVGDITRQRIEHVQTSIIHMQANAVMENSDGRLAALGYSLLQAQLAATMEDFNREVAEIERNMSEMAAHSRELLKLRDMAYGCGGGKGEGFLKDLGARVEQALVLVSEIEGADSSALRTGQATAAAAENLGTRISAIQSLKNDVQYMALNTTIKCAQIGPAARPLSVIAIELRDHGHRLEEAAAGGLAALGELTHAAGVLTSNDGSHQSAAQALGIAADLIRDARNRTESEISVLVSKGEAVLSVLDLSSERLAFRAQIGEKLENVASELAILGSAVPHSTDGIEAPLAAMLSEFHKLYTMAQERDVHQAFVESLGVTLEQPEVRAPSQSDLETVLF